jgi:hypothetical protein
METSSRRNQRKISNLGRNNKEKLNTKSVKLKWTNIEKKITKVRIWVP